MCLEKDRAGRFGQGTMGALFAGEGNSGRVKIHPQSKITDLLLAAYQPGPTPETSVFKQN
jgi:hypothetical protein